MTEYPHYDVAVIGYGPTGVTAANLLGADGLSVAVIERDADIYARARAISTDEEVVRIWQHAGLAERLKQDMLAERPLDFVDRNGRPFISASFTPRGHGHPPQMFLYQPALERVLREGVQRYPNVELRLEHECVRVFPRGDRVELMVVDLRTEEIKRITASYVIAADGGSSPTRGQLGVGFDGRTYEDHWVVVDTKMLQPWPGHDRLRFHCAPDRPAVDCPTPLDHHRWEFPVLPGEDEEQLVTEDAVWRLLNRQGISAEQVEILRAVVYSHHVRFASRWRIGRVFLAGDAAHVMPPWIGQGMASGVRDAHNLCWKLSGVLRGVLPESVLDTYETERQPHVRATTRRAVLVGRIITERRPAVTKVRDVIFRAAEAAPAVRQRMHDSLWVPDCRYRKGFLADDGRSATGWKIPQPEILDENGEKLLLDEVTGGRWTLLHRGPAPALPGWVGLAALRVLPAGSPARPGAVIDSSGLLGGWLAEKRATALVLRPDSVVYAATAPGRPLPAPPRGLRLDADRPAPEVAAS
ncbi:bifunctional 3-(3-hydroxy-phenyl)propionate/3-hydroxycinnamic acid hydroxylase [Amycolatopsis cynarae]|uniref:Bifunctional 3-(3-hydroxy-phenyl)propionate/3-hydroxycinnamic acid hydroxylase n=1 Tax=Amycolatopsis cynarae TaxID=2995223 RepID=A0ABY7B5Z4_9PSEU|nr:bifunctional 3-(3-hydroxy-phenyl)propionate/3-hydroxycinnamic acid hydroxylase [Amycolatopsis sp. HUAS 11-8]WAL67757.1 bifunctional 3-(3-hydroxy-phenyl)propionate/3-hydroxycinnamic acid hydroxylase [Amycolatopsis sp. HUAS 11-8]